MDSEKVLKHIDDQAPEKTFMINRTGPEVKLTGKAGKDTGIITG